MIKKVLLIVGCLVLLLVAVVAFLLWRLDPEALGQEVIRRVNEKGGLQLAAERFSIEPLRGVFIENARLTGETAAGSLTADVANVIVEYELLPILRKELVINRIVIEEARATLVSRPAAEPEGGGGKKKRAKGKKGAGAAGAQAAEVPAQPGGGFDRSLAIDEVRVVDASLNLATAGGGEDDVSIEGLSLDLNDVFVDPAASDPLLGLTARGGIEIERIETNEMTIEGGRGTIEMAQGVAVLRDIAVATDSASLSVAVLDLDLREDPPTYHVEAGGELDLDRFLGVEGDGGFGPAALTLALDGAASDATAATGRGNLAMEPGTLPSFPMVARIERLLGRSLITGTPYEVTEMTFALAEGVLSVDPFALELENLRLGGAGTVTLPDVLNLRLGLQVPRERLDIDVVSGVLDSMTGEDGWTVVPLEVRGPADDPDVDLDMSAAKEHAKDALDEAVESVLDKALRKAHRFLSGDKDDG